METLVFALPKIESQEQFFGSRNEQEDLNIGVIKPLIYPYNLFLNLKQLEDHNMEFVYFFVYTIGAKRIILWGVYDKSTEEFIIDGSCRYAPSELQTMVNTWKKNEQTYVANSVINRPKEIIARELGNKRMAYEEYLRDKFILAYINGQISKEELERRYPYGYDNFIFRFEEDTGLTEESPDYEIELMEYIDNLREQIIKYEKEINRTDLSSYTLANVSEEIYNAVNKITKQFYNAIKLGKFQIENFYSHLSPCPPISECSLKNFMNGCQVYYYGSPFAENINYYHAGDVRALL